MKKYGNIVVAAMAVLLVMGWINFLKTGVSTGSLYGSYYAQAQQEREKGLYQLSIRDYQLALEEKRTGACINALAQTCEEYYANDVSYAAQMLCKNTLSELISAYPQNAYPYEALANLYKQEENYDDIISVYEKAKNNHALSDPLQTMRQEIVYCYTEDYTGYNEVSAPINGCYKVRYGDKWGIIDTTGEEVVACAADAISPVGENGFYVVSQQEKSWIKNLDGYTYANLDFYAEDAGVMSEGLVPIKSNGTYAYYTKDGVRVCGDYDEAGTFSNGMAAVCQGDAWFIIDKEGNRQSDQTFEALATTNTGSFNAAGVYVVKQNGKFTICGTDWNPSSDFTCDEVDLLTAEGFAFEKDGKWGFADYKGNVLLEPQYLNARSFSNGQATVETGDGWVFIDRAGNRLGDKVFSGGGFLTSANSCMIQTKDNVQYKLIRFVG